MLRRLELALALDAHRSFHRAARAMGISQPSLTRALQVLETELGVRLFERGNADCEPTDFGRAVLARARRIVSEVAEAKRRIASLQGLETGELRIGAGSFVTQIWLGAAVGEVSAAYPQLRIRNVEYLYHQLPDALLAAEIDVAIGEASDLASYPDIVVSRLPRRPGVMICRADHPLAGLEKVAIDDLAKFPLAGPQLPPRIAMHLPPASALGVMTDRSGYFVPAILTATWMGIGDVVRESHALGIIPRATLPDLSQRCEVVALPFAAPWLQTQQALMWRRDRMMHPALKHFRATARRAEAAAMGNCGNAPGRAPVIAKTRR
ncbi:MAG: LysR family transcriptional regulator [Enhydrobacter sp.]|nr:LysR family transcriptional regulator [Enhydrobacter sp.]